MFTNRKTDGLASSGASRPTRGCWRQYRSRRWCDGTGRPLTMGNPQSSRLISSGSISAHTPRPAQAMKSTRIRAITGTSCGEPARRSRSRGTSRPCSSVQFGGEDPQRAARQLHRATGMPARAPAIHLTEPAPQRARIVPAAFREPLRFGGDRVQPEHAGSALPRRRVSQVADHPGGFPQPAGSSPGPASRHLLPG